MKFKNQNINAGLITAVAILSLLTVTNADAQTEKGSRSVYTNKFKDNWELSFGLEGLAFYSNNEADLNLSKSPFKSYRSNFGASAAVGKWFTPEIGLRTKASGYWGKSILSDDPTKNAIRFYSFQEHVMLNVTNMILGYNPERKWDVLPYGGLAFVRDCTHKDNSFGAAIGVTGNYKINHQVKAFADFELTLAGNEYKTVNGVTIPTVTGKYRWYSFEIGLTFNLGRSFWGGAATRNSKPRSEAIAPIGDISRYTGKKVVDYDQVMATSIVPTGMVLINRGHLRMGLENQDSLWGNSPIKDISVDDFWMDKTEVTNRQYHEFVKDVLYSIIKERMVMPEYMGDISRVMESLYRTNPVTGAKVLDTKQLNYKYEVYDYAEEAKRKNRVDPSERQLNTDIPVNPNEIVWISKDTAYIDTDGNIIRETIERPLTGSYDFLNTYIVNIYPDTTCWVNDFPNADNERYLRYYFSKKEYLDYPVVGVTWEQANAYCAWRTEKMMQTPGHNANDAEPFRLPTEAEWEYAARGKDQNAFPWKQLEDESGKGKFMANFQPDNGNYTEDGNIITSRVGIYPSNCNGLYDMAGNVAEWTSTAFTDAGVEIMNTINPQLKYNAAIEDPYRLKKKSVRGGSWKDPESHVQSAWRASEYQNQPRSYIGFRCVRTVSTSPSQKTILIVTNKK